MRAFRVCVCFGAASGASTSQSFREFLFSLLNQHLTPFEVLFTPTVHPTWASQLRSTTVRVSRSFQLKSRFVFYESTACISILKSIRMGLRRRSKFVRRDDYHRRRRLLPTKHISPGKILKLCVLRVMYRLCQHLCFHVHHDTCDVLYLRPDVATTNPPSTTCGSSGLFQASDGL